MRICICLCAQNFSVTSRSRSTTPMPIHRIDASSFEDIVRGIVRLGTRPPCSKGDNICMLYYRDTRPKRSGLLQMPLCTDDNQVRMAFVLAYQDILGGGLDSVVCVSEFLCRCGAGRRSWTTGIYDVHSVDNTTGVVISREPTAHTVLASDYIYVGTVFNYEDGVRGHPHMASSIGAFKIPRDSSYWMNTASAVSLCVQNFVWWPLHSTGPSAQEDEMIGRRLAIAQIGGLLDEVRRVVADMDSPWSTFDESLCARGHHHLQSTLPCRAVVPGESQAPRAGEGI